MASEGANERRSAVESLVYAIVTVIDNLEVQAHFDRASMESAKRLGSSKITYLS